MLHGALELYRELDLYFGFIGRGITNCIFHRDVLSIGPLDLYKDSEIPWLYPFILVTTHQKL